MIETATEEHVPGGSRVKLPEGKILTDMLRLGMASGQSRVELAAKAAGLSRNVYAFGRKLLTLRDRQVLSRQEEQTVGDALQMLESGRFLIARRIAKGVLSKHWTSGTPTGTRKDGRQRREMDKLRLKFDKTIFAIREICSDKENLAIPTQLTRAECHEAEDILRHSISSLRELLNRLEEEK